MNTITGRVVSDTGPGAPASGLALELPGGRVPVPDTLAAGIREHGLEEVVVGVRPEDLTFAPSGTTDETIGVDARVTVVESLGHERHVGCRLNDRQLVIVRQDAHDAAPKVETATRLVADPAAVHVFDPVSGRRMAVGGE
jgi:multiple sugar transport system ATP-binding protein